MTDVNTERAHWDEKGTRQDPMFEMWADKPNTVQCVNLLLEDFDPSESVGAKIVEIGCGIGRLSQAVQDRFLNATVYGVDISPKLLEMANALADEQQVIKKSVYLLCDGRSLPDDLPNDIDYFYSMVVFQHIPNEAKKAYLKEVAKHLKVGGLFRFQLVEGDEQSDYNHHMSEADVRAMCAEAGLFVESTDQALMYKNWLWVTVSKGASNENA